MNQWPNSASFTTGGAYMMGKEHNSVMRLQMFPVEDGTIDPTKREGFGLVITAML